MIVAAIFAIAFLTTLIGMVENQSAFGYFYMQGEPGDSEAFTASVRTDRDAYVAGEQIIISGKVNQYDESRELQVSIMDSARNLVFFETIPVDSDGMFSYTISDTGEFTEKGTYSIRAQYGKKDVTVGTFSFSFDPAEKSEMKTAGDSMMIPDWIKTNAKWWSEGSVDDDSFVQGIQWLIKEKIMKIPATQQESDSGSDEIPSWVKNNAEWWADGQIDDESFIQGIQYMIKVGIMKI